jgi:hypothetical protein
MNYIYIFAGTIFTMIFIAQMLAFAAFTKKNRVYVKK